MWIIPSVLLICGAVIGTRVVFSMPLELKANWVFRLVASPDVAQCVAATRRALYMIAVLPVSSAMAILFFWLWPWRLAAGHLIVLALVASIVTEVMLFGFHKIPFTCSYLPGKSHLHMAVIGFLGFMFLAVKGYRIEWDALQNASRFLPLLTALLAAAIAARWRTERSMRREASVQFEEEEEPAIFELGLHRDGHLVVD